MIMTDVTKRPVAVVGTGNTVTARVLRRLIDHPVVELTPCGAVMEHDGGQHYRAVVVENFDPPVRGSLSPCAAAQWELSRRADVTVVALDDREGRNLAARKDLPIYAYSDGRPQADLTAKNIRLRADRLEFEALTDRQLLRVRVPLIHGPRLYDYLAALAGALALGVPLEQAACRLAAGC